MERESMYNDWKKIATVCNTQRNLHIQCNSCQNTNEIEKKTLQIPQKTWNKQRNSEQKEQSQRNYNT
jgi:hypothetical protein